MDVLFLEAPYSGEVNLCAATLNYLKKEKYTKVALYASVQFCNNLEIVKQQLEKANIAVITSKPDRTHVKSQLLGCDNYHSSLHLAEKELQEIDAYLYVGDGKFHPLALVYAQKDSAVMKEIICNDPMRKAMTLMGLDDIKTKLRRYRGALLKFFSAKDVGVIITVKPGQEHLRPSFFLEKIFPEKKFYYFIDDTVSFNQLENFPFIEVWVNTACPRIGFDDQLQFRKGVINLNDALNAKEILSTESVINRI
ncbi:MAG TPA: diphthamide synthesis protein [Candidatus Nanoarchaeia archaeon]|nr:diphthamide synthesis protein [Candidatus Nanoarchaeia archaeon]